MHATKNQLPTAWRLPFGIIAAGAGMVLISALFVLGVWLWALLSSEPFTNDSEARRVYLVIYPIVGFLAVIDVALASKALLALRVGDARRAVRWGIAAAFALPVQVVILVGVIVLAVREREGT